MRVQRRDCGVGNAFAFALALDTRLGTLGSVFDRNETGSADSLWSFSPSQGDAMQTAPSDNKNLEFSAKDDLGWSHLIADRIFLTFTVWSLLSSSRRRFSDFASEEGGKGTASHISSRRKQHISRNASEPKKKTRNSVEKQNVISSERVARP